MAGFEDDKDDLFDTQRLSLLDVIEERNRALNKKSMLNRMVVVGKLRPDMADKRDLGQHYEKVYRLLQQSSQSQGGPGEGVSGLLLIYPGTCIQVLETTPDIMRTIIEDMVKTTSQKASMITDARILNISHDIPMRTFPQWNYRTLNLHAMKTDDFETNEPLETTVLQILKQMLQLGVHISKQPKMNLKAALDSLVEKVPKLLPAQDVLLYLLRHEKLNSPKKYLDYYERPVDVVLDSDLTWPVYGKKFPYSIELT